MLDTLGITALINVSANCPNHFEGHYQYKSIPVEDNHKADISSWFNEAIEFIGEFLYTFPPKYHPPSPVCFPPVFTLTNAPPPCTDASTEITTPPKRTHTTCSLEWLELNLNLSFPPNWPAVQPCFAL